MNSSIRLLVFVGLGVCQAFSLFAQSAPTKLSLTEAIRLAEQQQPAYKASGLERDLAYQLTRESRAGWLPKLSADADLRYNAQRQTSIVPNFADVSRPAQAVQFGQPWQGSAGLTLQQAIYQPTQSLSVEARKVGERQAETNLLKARLDLQQNVRSAYFDVLLQQSRLKFAEADLKRTDQLLKELEARLSEGRALSTDVASAKLNQADAIVAVRQATANLMLARQVLASELGLDTTAAQSISLTDTLAESTDLTAKEGDPLAQRPEFRLTQLKATLASVNERVQGRNLLPTVNFNAFIGANGFGTQFNNVLSLGNNWFGSSYLGVSVNWILFDGMARQAKRSTERIRQVQALAEQESWKLRISREVSQANVQSATALENLGTRRQSQTLAMASYRIAEARYWQGRATTSELLDAETSVARAQRDYLQTLYEYLLARIQLSRAQGELVE